jgi:peroxiredoxin Q/BCP
MPDETGTLRHLSDYLGRPVVLYFQSKDDTSGCTTEACNFRDDTSAYTKISVSSLGSALYLFQAVAFGFFCKQPITLNPA